MSAGRRAAGFAAGLLSAAVLGAFWASDYMKLTPWAMGLCLWSGGNPAGAGAFIPEETVPQEPLLSIKDGGVDIASLSGVSELAAGDFNREAADAGAVPYPEIMESHDGVISAVYYQEASGVQYFSLPEAGQVRNMTSVPMDVLMEESGRLPEFKIDFGDKPQVLIMHTHTTESFEPYERDFYDASFYCRTTDERKNVVAVGEAMASQLKAAGIGVIHDKTIHDYPSYNGAYERSAETVRRILSQNPTIKVVIDLHRDAIERNGGERIAPTAEIGGKKAAQVMIISGCDDGTMNMPDYMKNFRLACLWQKELEGSYKGLTRPVLFAYKKYNQDLTSGSLLIEIGGHANSIDQAVYSGELAGRALAKALSGLAE